jgi:hypothetical protein
VQQPCGDAKISAASFDVCSHVSNCDSFLPSIQRYDKDIEEEGAHAAAEGDRSE